MKESCRIAPFKFPQADWSAEKLRPALLIGRLPGHFGDWLICMISSQLRHCVEGFDELIPEDADDFSTSGLRAASLIRVGRLAVVDESVLVGSIGEIAPERLRRIKCAPANRLLNTDQPKPDHLIKKAVGIAGIKVTGRRFHRTVGRCLDIVLDWLGIGGTVLRARH